MAQTDRGVLRRRLGNQDRELVFRSTQVGQLEEELGGVDPLTYLSRGGARISFLTKAIMVGLAGGPKEDRVTPRKIGRWLDDDLDLDHEQLVIDILYCIARNKPSAEAKRMVEALDDVFGRKASDDVDDEDGAPARPSP